MKYCSKKLVEQFRVWFGLLFVLFVAGCAHTKGLEHGVGMTVYGTTTIEDVKVEYGKKTIVFMGVTRPGGGDLWNAPMPIPSQMSISWKAAGQQLEAVIPLEGRVAKTARLANWRLKFYGERVELWRQDDDPGNPYSFRPSVQVYP